jgi:hypothetical protein
MFDVVEQGVLQTKVPDGTTGANALGDLYASPIARKERLRGQFPALALRHPTCVEHIGSFPLGLYRASGRLRLPRSEIIVMEGCLRISTSDDSLSTLGDNKGQTPKGRD